MESRLEEITMALLKRLVEKDKAKKVYNTVAFDRCPECECILEHDWYAFCPICGQRLDWSE